MLQLWPDKDIQIHKAKAGRVPLLILQPRHPKKDAPGVLWIHGGGYMDREKLLEFLKEGEEILWEGKAEPIRILDDTNASSFWKKLIISAAVTVLAIALYWYFSVRNGVEVSSFIIGFFAVCGLISPVRFWTDARRVRKQKYIATDRRLIVQSDTMLDVPYSFIHEAVFKRDADGHGTLLCGKDAVKKDPAKWRVASILCNINEIDSKDPCRNFVFYAVEDPEKLLEVLKEKLPVLKQ